MKCFSFFQAYVEYVKCMGGLWLERNIPVFLNHVLNLVGSPKATPTHVDAVYARKCVLFILRSTIGALLGEKAQIAAAKEISQIIIKQMNAVGKFSSISRHQIMPHQKEMDAWLRIANEFFFFFLKTWQYEWYSIEKFPTSGIFYQQIIIFIIFAFYKLFNWERQ